MSPGLLIDEFLPRWDVRSRHSLRVQAPPEPVFAALRSADLGGHPVVRALLLLRALPAALLAPGELRRLRRRARLSVTLATFEEQGFRVLAQHPPRELLLGLEGEFWKPGGALRPVDPVSFRQPVPAGSARAVWNFRVVPDGDGACVLHTETRVRTGDAASHRRFALYWAVIRPGSGLIRRLMLRAVRAEAERSAGRRT